jgi:hypothetical protein
MQANREKDPACSVFARCGLVVMVVTVVMVMMGGEYNFLGDVALEDAD